MHPRTLGSILFISMLLASCENGNHVDWRGGDELTIEVTDPGRCKSIFKELKKDLNMYGIDIWLDNTTCEDRVWAHASVYPPVMVNYYHSEDLLDNLQTQLDNCNDRLHRDLSDLIERNSHIFTVRKCTLKNYISSTDQFVENGEISYTLNAKGTKVETPSSNSGWWKD